MSEELKQPDTSTVSALENSVEPSPPSPPNPEITQLHNGISLRKEGLPDLPGAGSPSNSSDVAANSTLNAGASGLHPRAPGEAFDPASSLWEQLAEIAQLEADYEQKAAAAAAAFDASDHERPARAAKASSLTAPAKPTGEAISGASVRVAPVAESARRFAVVPSNPRFTTANAKKKLDIEATAIDSRLERAIEFSTCEICGGRSLELAEAAGHHAAAWVWLKQGALFRWARIRCDGTEVKP